MGFLKLIVQVFFLCVLSWRGWFRRVGGSKGGGSKGGGSKGGGSNPEKVGPRRVGSRKVEGPKGGGPESGALKGGGEEGWGAQNFALFFPCPAAKFVLFFPLWGSSRGILVVFEALGRSNVHVWSSLAKP